MSKAQWCPTCVRKLPPGLGLGAAETDLKEAVREVLADHIWRPRRKGPAECWSANDRPCRAQFTTGGEYRSHVADLVVGRIFHPQVYSNERVCGCGCDNPVGDS